MKTIEQKAKAYDEALERAKNLHKDAIDMGENIRAKQCETIFPELQESEDERIRKRIIHALHGDVLDMEETNKAIAWLEKQGGITNNRQLYNRAILAILSNYVEKYPDIRFGQMLYNLGVNPHFDEESKETYCNLNETINKKS